MKYNFKADINVEADSLLMAQAIMNGLEADGVVQWTITKVRKKSQPDPQAEVALRRLNDKSDKIISTAAMEKAVIAKPKRKNNCPTYIGSKRRAK